MKGQELFFDMDGVGADFYGHPSIGGEKRGYGNYPEMYEVGFFRDLPLVAGALEHLTNIIKHNNVYILSQPVKESPHSYSEKVEWILKHFPALEGKIILTQEKGLLAGVGRILIDDNKDKWQEAWESRGGVFIHFDENECPEAQWAMLAHVFVPQVINEESTHG